MSTAPRPVALALLFCSGAIAAAALPRLPSAAMLIGLAVLAAVLWVAPGTRTVAALLSGGFWFLAHAWQLQHQSWPAERAGERLELVGTVVGVPVQRDGRARLEIRPDREARTTGAPKRILAEWYRPKEWFRPGERWRFELRLDPPVGRVNPGLFDAHRHLISRGIGATARIDAATRLAPPGPRSAADRQRQRFADWLQAEMADLEAAALARALTVADRSAISDELDERLQRTGTAHLLSISGLHVGMVAALTGGLAVLLVTPLAALLGWPDRRRAAVLAGLAGALGYALLAGFTLPTQRALVMLATGFGAVLLRRPVQPGRALVVALLAVLLLDPMAPLAPGFWLSFGAVAVLIWGLAGRPAQGSRLLGLLRAQVLIAIGMLPLNIGVFGEWAPTALLANLVAIPLVGFWVLPMLLLALAGFGLGVPVGVPVAAAEAGLRVLGSMLEQLMALDAAVVDLGQLALPAPSLVALLLAAVGALWLLAPRGWPLRPLGLALLLPLLWPGREALQPGEFDLLLPDLGDGVAVLIRSRDHVLLFGAGPGDGAERHQVERSLAPLLRQTGARFPDWIVLPTAMRDYAGGAAAAVARWPQAMIWGAGGQGSVADLADRRCVAGAAWEADGIRFEFLHPGAALPDLGADSACVLEIRSDAGRVVLPGPVGERVLKRLLLEDRAQAADAVLLPASGHRRGLAPEWLDAVGPAIALAALRPHHPRGLPHREVRDALAARGVALATTAACGAIRLRFRLNRAPQLEAERVRKPRFWRAATGCPATE